MTFQKILVKEEIIEVYQKRIGRSYQAKLYSCRNIHKKHKNTKSLNISTIERNKAQLQCFEKL